MLASDDGVARVREALTEAPGHRSRLSSTYYDTPEWDLRTASLSLRIRCSGSRFIQTVKTVAAGAIERGEWEHTVPSDRIDPDSLCVTPAWVVLDGRVDELAAIFSTSVDRESHLIEQNGARIEASLDLGETIAGDRRERIRELELELKDGPPAELFALARRLAVVAPIFLASDSKAEHGYRLCEGISDDPRTSQVPDLTGATEAAEAFRRIARECLAQITSNAGLLRRTRQPEALHQLRVGVRRLRTAIRIFGEMLEGKEHRWIDGELEWLAGKLDAARDLDVLLHDTFEPAANALGADLAPLGRCLLAASARAYRSAITSVGSVRYRRLALETAAWIEAGSWVVDDRCEIVALRTEAIETLSREVLEHLRHDVRKRGRDLSRLEPKQRHQLRIRTNRLRYASEFFGPLHGHKHRRAEFLTGLKQLQDLLGELNDIAVSRDRLLDDPELQEARISFAAGRIVGWRERKQPQLLKSARHSYEAWSSITPFWI